MEDERDWLQYYDDEGYLLEVVGPNFLKTGEITAADFYMILIWKAERAKNYHRKRLKKLAKGSFEEAVTQIAASLYAQPDQKERLKILMNAWWFQLPTASAILSILYPHEFTVYDWRVCKEVSESETYTDLSYRNFSDSLWTGYEGFRDAVIRKTPSNLSLREKDRYLIGRSFRQQLENECRC